MIVDATDNLVGAKRAVGVPSVTDNAIGGGATAPIMPRQAGSGTARGKQTLFGETVVIDDKSTPRVVMGWDPDVFTNGGGIKVSLPGVDVTKATAEELTLNTDDVLIKQVKGFQATIPGGTIPSTDLSNPPVLWYVPHGLSGPPPILIAHVKDSFSIAGFVADSPLPFVSLASVSLFGFTVTRAIRAWVDSANVYFSYNVFNTTFFTTPADFVYPEILIKVRLLQRTATPDTGV